MADGALKEYLDALTDKQSFALRKWLRQQGYVVVFVGIAQVEDGAKVQAAEEAAKSQFKPSSGGGGPSSGTTGGSGTPNASPAGTVVASGPVVADRVVLPDDVAAAVLQGPFARLSRSLRGHVKDKVLDSALRSAAPPDEEGLRRLRLAYQELADDIEAAHRLLERVLPPAEPPPSSRRRPGRPAA